MKSVTLVFPGQGSQYVGMGKNLDPHLVDLFHKADNILNYSLSHLCFEGPMEDLKLTANTQPAILTHSVALFTKLQGLLESKGAKVDRVLGHSVGEYPALVAAGAISFEDAVMAVHLRGKYMQDAVPVGEGKMYAILKSSEEDVRKACEAVSTPESKVVPANFNDPSQIVISGHSKACEAAVAWLQTNAATKCRAMELPVSAPFHSPLMAPAAKKLEEHLKTLTFHPNRLPYVANINAQEYAAQTSPDVIRQNLIDQVCGSVLWMQSIAKLAPNTLFIEVGPGKVLKGMIKKILPEATCISLEDEGSWEELEKML